MSEQIDILEVIGKIKALVEERAGPINSPYGFVVPDDLTYNLMEWLDDLDPATILESGPMILYDVLVFPEGVGGDSGLDMTFTILAQNWIRADKQAKAIVGLFLPGFVIWDVKYKKRAGTYRAMLEE